MYIWGLFKQGRSQRKGRHVNVIPVINILIKDQKRDLKGHDNEKLSPSKL